jgi:hypothetical protein
VLISWSYSAFQGVYDNGCLPVLRRQLAFIKLPALSMAQVLLAMDSFCLSAFCLLVLLHCEGGDSCTPLLLAGRVTSVLRSELKMDFPIGQK